MSVSLADMAAFEAGLAEMDRMAGERASDDMVLTFSAMTGSRRCLVVGPGMSWTAFDDRIEPEAGAEEANRHFRYAAPVSNTLWRTREELS